jgi:general secretion pathway protein D
MPSTLLISSSLRCRRSAIVAFCLTVFLVGSGRSWCQEANITNIAFPGADLEDVLVEYETLTGNHLIRTPGTEATVNIVQNPNSPMTKAQAIDFLRDSLLYHGIAIVPERPGVEKVVPWSGGTPFDWPSPEPGYQKVLYTDPSELPEGNAFINYSMRLQYVGAEEAAQQFTTLMPPQSWRYTPIPSAGTVIISATVPVIRTLIALKEQIDVREQARENRFIQLRLADAEEVAGQITELISAQEQLRSQNGRVGARSAAQRLAGNAANPNNVPVPLQGAAGGGGGESSDQTATLSTGSGVIVQSDARTNRILLNGRKVDVDYIEILALEFDQPADVESLLTKQLRYFSVLDFLDVAAGGLERFSSRGAGAAGGGIGGAGANQSRQNRQTQNNGGNLGNQANQGFAGNQTGSNTSRSSRGGGGGGAGGRQLQTQQLIPQSVTVDKTLLIADPRSNSIIVSGPPEHLSFINDLIDKMDVRPRQVYISAVLAQVTLGGNIQFGTDILRTVETFKVGGETVDAAGIFRNISGGTGIIDPNTLASVADFPLGAAGFNTYANIGDYFTGYLRALESRSDFKVLARPFVYTANNEVATISIGERVPVPTSQQSSVVTGGTQSLNTNITFEDVLLELQVVPLISSENEVTLTIAQINDNITGSTSINGDDIPIISTQTLDTTVTVPNGGVVVIGGLISKSETVSRSGLPFITKLPLLGTLLGSTSKDTSRNELLIFVQPRIITSTSSLVAAHADQVRRSVIADEVEDFSQPPYDTDHLILPGQDGDIQWNEAGKTGSTPSQGDGAESKTRPAAASGAKKTRKKSLGSWIKGIFDSK